MLPKLVAYVAGPYRAETHSGVYDNIQRARKVAERQRLELKGESRCQIPNCLLQTDYAKSPTPLIKASR